MTDDAIADRRFQVFDTFVVLSVYTVSSFVVGAIWSFVRVGTVTFLFVREAQFIFASIAFGLWVVRNKSGDRTEANTDAETITVPPLHARIDLYRTVSNDTAVRADAALDVDAHLFVIATVLALLSLGVELIVLWGGP